ncbi:MAG: hypothetical protein GTO63_18360 [Anaerolineae bacterium]|nr:hypothetical protein [Anaerolineae bacterium]NIN96734.1 hypothetical protein [Anaerolineae bacterium]
MVRERERREKDRKRWSAEFEREREELAGLSGEEIEARVQAKRRRRKTLAAARKAKLDAIREYVLAPQRQRQMEEAQQAQAERVWSEIRSAHYQRGCRYPLSHSGGNPISCAYCGYRVVRDSDGSWWEGRSPSEYEAYQAEQEAQARAEADRKAVTKIQSGTCPRSATKIKWAGPDYEYSGDWDQQLQNHLRAHCREMRR